jgi:hypothetical protein
MDKNKKDKQPTQQTPFVLPDKVWAEHMKTGNISPIKYQQEPERSKEHF